MKLAEIWKELAVKLGLEIISPFSLTMSDGSELQVDVLLKNFGAEKGMLLVDDYSKIEGYTSSILSLGYGYSVLSSHAEPHALDDEAAKEMLAEWTWSGSLESRPGWLDDIVVRDEE